MSSDDAPTSLATVTYGEPSLATLLKVPNPGTTAVSDLKKLVAAELFPDLPAGLVPRLKLYDVIDEDLGAFDDRLMRQHDEEPDIVSVFAKAILLSPFDMVADSVGKRKAQDGTVQLLVVRPREVDLLHHPSLSLNHEPPPYRRTAAPKSSQSNADGVAPSVIDNTEDSTSNTKSADTTREGARQGEPSSDATAERSWEVATKTGILDEVLVVAAIVSADNDSERPAARAPIPAESIEKRQSGSKDVKISPGTKVDEPKPKANQKDILNDISLGKDMNTVAIMIKSDKSPTATSDSTSITPPSPSNAQRRRRVIIYIAIALLIAIIAIAAILGTKLRHSSSDDNTSQPSPTTQPQTPQTPVPSGPSTFEGHRDQVMALALIPNSTFLVSGSLDGTIVVWDIQTGLRNATYNAMYAVYSLAVNSAGDRIWSGGGNSTGGYATEWSIQDTPLRALGTVKYVRHAANVTKVFLGYDDGRTVLFTASKDLTVGMWNLYLGNLTQYILQSPKEVNTVVARLDSPGYWSVFAGMPYSVDFSDVDILRWSVGPNDRTGTPIPSRNYTNAEWATNALVLSTDGKRMWSGHTNGWVGVWDVSTSDTTLVGSEWKDSDSAIECLERSEDGRWIWGGSADGKLWQWDASSGVKGKGVATQPAHVGAVRSILVAGGGSVVFSGGADNVIRRWNVTI
ncbi:WD repeat-containing protein 18 [Rhizophlyctis rosea]|nr:WD repeat-containing protein 18 [Rhizophlyctis rosea]